MSPPQGGLGCGQAYRHDGDTWECIGHDLSGRCMFAPQ